MLHFLKSRFSRLSPEVRMVAIFLGFTLTLQALYRLTRDSLWPLFVYKYNAALSVWLINLITPAESVVAKGDIISAPGISIQIAPGCDGADALILLFSALAAAPLKLKHKLWGILVGGIFVSSCNMLRTLILYYTYKYKRELFELMHSYVGQTFIILTGVLFFLVWVYGWTQNNEPAKNS